MTRFEFGANWRKFLSSLTEERIRTAESTLLEALERTSLDSTTFLDIGSGSGLFSLAARRLGARVHSFDFDPQSVACTDMLRERYFPADESWRVEQGSVLDSGYLKRLPSFDIVYSWGVLHHTGDMWSAIDNSLELVDDGGQLFLALYNDQGFPSTLWRWIKKTYCMLPGALRWIVLLPCAARLWGPTILKDFARLRPMRTWREYERERGMSPWRDVVDWVGGYPFEVATPDEVVGRIEKHGFALGYLKTVNGGSGCNEFVFRKVRPGT